MRKTFTKIPETSLDFPDAFLIGKICLSNKKYLFYFIPGFQQSVLN